MKVRTKTDTIVIHCTATPPQMDIGVKEVRHWHKDPKPKGNGWEDIGYHFVIRRNGVIEEGRQLDLIGAHVEGHNSTSVGVSLVGGIDAKKRPENNFTPAQWQSLRELVDHLRQKWPAAHIVGHRQLDPKKACPSFDVPEWLRSIGWVA